MTVLEGASHHQVLLATNGGDALNLARRQHPDIVLLDIRMPDLNGREVRDRLKADPETSHIPLVAVTASSMMNEELQLREVFDGYIRKPLTRSILFREMAHLLPPAHPETASPAGDEATNAKVSSPPFSPQPAWHELLAYLRDSLADPWPEIVKSMGVRETSGFARSILAHAEKAACPPVVSYAEKLLEHIESFRIGAAETTLKAYPEVIEDLANRLEDEAS